MMTDLFDLVQLLPQISHVVVMTHFASFP
jgi:hypothetical protein